MTFTNESSLSLMSSTGVQLGVTLFSVKLAISPHFMVLGFVLVVVVVVMVVVVMVVVVTVVVGGDPLFLSHQ